MQPSVPLKETSPYTFPAGNTNKLQKTTNCTVRRLVQSWKEDTVLVSIDFVLMILLFTLNVFRILATICINNLRIYNYPGDYAHEPNDQQFRKG